MLKQKIPYLFVLLCLSGKFALAQTPQQVEDSVNHYLSEVASSTDNESKLSAHQDLKRMLSRVLLKPEIFHHPFSSVEKMAILGEPENGLRIWSWHVPFRNASPEYGCFVVQFDEKKQMSSVHELTQDENEDLRDRAIYTNKNWPGALYYELVPIGKKKPDYYLLFGWDGHNDLSNKKLVDVLHFSSGNLKLGKPVFSKEGKSVNRLVFEYREDAVFSLDYYPDRDMIVFEDLGPTHPSLEGKPAHYVPMRSFSGYEYQKQKWVYQSEVDFKRDRDDRDKMFIDPEETDMNRQRSNENPLTGE